MAKRAPSFSQVRATDELENLGVNGTERQMNATKQPRHKCELFVELQKLKGLL